MAPHANIPLLNPATPNIPTFDSTTLSVTQAQNYEPPTKRRRVEGIRLVSFRADLDAGRVQLIVLDDLPSDH